MRILRVLAASALILAGTTPVLAASAKSAVTAKGEVRLAKILAGRVPGKPVQCIFLPQVRSTQIISGTAIVYDAGRTLYVNRPESGARWMSSGDVLVTKPHANQLCNVDIVRLLDQGTHFQRGSVGLGDFVPYTRAAR
jgi:hypothetical protein